MRRLGTCCSERWAGTLDADELVATGAAHSLSPAGRRFRQWASIPAGDELAWASLLDRALRYVSQLGDRH